MVAIMLFVLGDIGYNVQTWPMGHVQQGVVHLGRSNGMARMLFDVEKSIVSKRKAASTSAVTDHLRAVAAVVEVGAELEHARVTVRFTAAAAAAEWVRYGNATTLRRQARVRIAR